MKLRREREDRIESDISPVTVSTTVDERSRRPDIDQANQKFPKTNKKETMIERCDPLFADSGCASSEIPEWLHEFREIWWMMEFLNTWTLTPVHEASLEPTSKRREDLGKHSVNTHFPKDRNCKICQRTKNYKGPRAEDAMAEPYLVLKMLVT